MTISARYIVKELDRLGWDYRLIDEALAVMEITPPGCRSTTIKITKSEFDSSIGRYLANLKDVSYRLCKEAGISVPESQIFKNIKEGADFLKQLKMVVVKPDDGAHGEGVTTDIDNIEDLCRAVEYAKSLGYEKILVQEQAQGVDLRILFIDDQYMSSIIRHPAEVVGDGEHSVVELIKAENSKESRGIGYSRDLNEINIDAAKLYLNDSINKIPESGEIIQVIGAANIGLGGTSEDITNTINPDIIEAARTAKNACRVTHAGVDFMIPDPTAEVSESNKLSFIEVNAGPMLAFHENPNIGKGVNVSNAYLNWLKDQLSMRN